MDKYKKFTTRIENLIREFNEEILPKREPGYFSGDFVYPKEMYDKLSNWLIKTENVLCLIFNEESLQIQRFRSIRDNMKKQENLYVRIHQIKGLLEGCLDDIKEGFLQGQEFMIANEVFDSVLEEAEFFLKEQENKDISAILLRIVLGDALKRIAKKENIEIIDTNGKPKKFSVLNDELKSKGVYNQTNWRQIQAWLDIGNEASKGRFEEYNFNQVQIAYEGISNFISNYFVEESPNSLPAEFSEKGEISSKKG